MSSLGLIDFPTRPSSFLYTPPPITLLQLTSPPSNCFSFQPPVRLTLYSFHSLVRILSVTAHFPLRAGILLRTSSCPPVTQATQLDLSSPPFRLISSFLRTHTRLSLAPATVRSLSGSDSTFAPPQSTRLAPLSFWRDQPAFSVSHSSPRLPLEASNGRAFSTETEFTSKNRPIAITTLICYLELVWSSRAHHKIPGQGGVTAEVHNEPLRRTSRGVDREHRRNSHSTASHSCHRTRPRSRQNTLGSYYNRNGS